MRSWTGFSFLSLAAAALAAQACRQSVSGGEDPPPSPPAGDEQETGGDAVPAGNDPDPGTYTGTPLIVEYGLCFASECASGLECVSWGVSSYCLKPCSGDTCAATQRCADGYCLQKAGYYEICARFDACAADAYCHELAQVAPTRCVPVCDPGDLAGFSAVPSCPALPASLNTGAPSCTANMLASSTAKLCTAEAAVVERCDQLALRCNDGDQRPDTDPALEAASASAPDPGALRCLAAGAESICARVCSIDGGASTSPCACPAADPLCDDPSDQGLAWQCLHWTGLATDLRACAMIEVCTNNTTCADNITSGLTACKASPYDGISGQVCQRP